MTGGQIQGKVTDDFSLCYDTVIGVTGVELKLLQNTED